MYDKKMEEDSELVCYDEDTNEPCIISNEYVLRIKGAELLLGITILNFNYFPILTYRENHNKGKFYLFDFIKIWQKDISSLNFDSLDEYENDI